MGTTCAIGVAGRGETVAKAGVVATRAEGAAFGGAVNGVVGTEVCAVVGAAVGAAELLALAGWRTDRVTKVARR